MRTLIARCGTTLVVVVAVLLLAIPTVLILLLLLIAMLLLSGLATLASRVGRVVKVESVIERLGTRLFDYEEMRHMRWDFLHIVESEAEMGTDYDRYWLLSEIDRHQALTSQHTSNGDFVLSILAAAIGTIVGTLFGLSYATVVVTFFGLWLSALAILREVIVSTLPRKTAPIVATGES